MPIRNGFGCARNIERAVLFVKGRGSVMADKNGDQGKDKIRFVCLELIFGLPRKHLQLGVSSVVVNVAHAPFSSFVSWIKLSILCGGLCLF
jgi:hypothetical protein